MDAYPPDFTKPWYHGSDRPLTILKNGSSITQVVEVARAFSHQPGLVEMSDDYRIRHNGTATGYLHIVDEPLSTADIEPHPHQANELKWEWLIKREIRVRLIESFEPDPDQLLTEEEQSRLRQRGGSSYTPDK